MKKNLLTSIAGIFLLNLTQAQIPNGGFEDWEQIDNYETPLNWSTNQDTFYTRLVKDTIAAEGMYSMKLIPSDDIYLHGCESWAGTHVNFTSALPPNSHLSFYVKAIPEDPLLSNDVYFRVGVLSFDSITQIGSNAWETYTPIEEFTQIDIPLAGENIHALYIALDGAGISNPVDGPCQNRSFVWIDGMTIDSNLSGTIFQSRDAPDVFIFPNPSSGLIDISYPNGTCIAYELYSTIGELISTDNIYNNQLTIYKKGTFMLRLLTEVNGHKEYHCNIVVFE